MLKDTARERALATRAWRRRLGRRGGDRFHAGGRELLFAGWGLGPVVGASLAWARPRRDGSGLARPLPAVTVSTPRPRRDGSGLARPLPAVTVSTPRPRRDGSGLARPLPAVTVSTPRPRRDDSGLTTLEWLLITAAVAGIAALAVVLVQNQVEDTSADVAAEHPRRKAAEIAGEGITRDARSELSETAADNTADSVAAVNGGYGAKCGRLAITYRGLDLAFTWHDAVAGNPRPADGVTESLCNVTRNPQ